jgi:hypothetical protein
MAENLESGHLLAYWSRFAVMAAKSIKPGQR